MELDIKKFWKAIAEQDAEKIRSYFNKTATIRWHNTNEQFTLEEFIKANCAVKIYNFYARVLSTKFNIRKL